MEIKNELPKKSPLSMQMDLSKFELATADEKRQQDRMRESTTFFKDGIRKLKKDKISIACLVILAIIMIIAFVVPSFYPYDYATTSAGKNSITTNYLAPFQYSPAEQAIIDSGGHVFPHILGTDELGRDYAARVIFGTSISLLVGIIAAAIVVLIGVIYGAVSGYFGGKVDLVMMRIVDIIYSLPDMLMVILLSVVLKEVLTPVIQGTFLDKIGSNMISLFIVFGVLYWVGMARLVRGQILSIKENEYILAARSIGAKPGRIIRKHILPNCLSVIIISTALQVPSAIFTESFLSFVSLGVQAPMPSLGSLANAARGGMMSYPHKLVFPSIVICLIVLAFNLLGDGLRDAFDPKLRR